MIINALLSAISGLLSVILTPVNLPGLPDDFMDNLSAFFDTLDYADTIIPLVFPVNLSIYLGLAGALFVFSHAYKPVKLIVSKIIDLIP